MTSKANTRMHLSYLCGSGLLYSLLYPPLHIDNPPIGVFVTGFAARLNGVGVRTYRAQSSPRGRAESATEAVGLTVV